MRNYEAITAIGLHDPDLRSIGSPSVICLSRSLASFVTQAICFSTSLSFVVWKNVLRDNCVFILKVVNNALVREVRLFRFGRDYAQRGIRISNKMCFGGRNFCCFLFIYLQLLNNYLFWPISFL